MSAAVSLTSDERDLLERLGRLEDVETALDMTQGPEYPLDYPYGYAEPIDGPLDVDEWLAWRPEP